jgi:hypothetical protein
VLSERKWRGKDEGRKLVGNIEKKENEKEEMRMGMGMEKSEVQ